MLRVIKRKVSGFSVILCFVLYLHSTYAVAQKKYLFEKIGSDHTNVHFINEIPDSTSCTGKKNYIYSANSSGTGVADLNNDGKADIFFSSNTGEFKLYLNEGDFRFKDVTAEAGVKGNGKWGTGVCIADINGDGLLDIYVAHSGDFSDKEDLCNEAFICTGIDAKGVPHYVNKAKELGLDLPGTMTTQVVFLDYDHDGDLDCFVLNHSKNQHGQRLIRDNFRKDTSTQSIGYNLLLRNDFKDGKEYFTDVSEHAGISNSRRNFGLGVVVSDFNNDNWPDIYTTSDFAERDHLYLNNHDGTFSETAESSFRHISMFSMGVDAADINNDLMPDLMTLDMLPDDNYHLKLQMHPDNTDQFELMLKTGLSQQYVRNMLQLNMGNDNGVPKFAEVGQMSGVSNTNWSWTPLFVDFNNDGWKDLFVSSGFLKDLSDQDAQNKYISSGTESGAYGDKRLNSSLFLNNKSFSFTKQESWKAEDLEMSYSACAADFDNDGNVDILIANLNNEVSILKNNMGSAAGNYINIRLKEKDKNPFALGAKVIVTGNGMSQMQELENVRGYQSSQDYVLHFGLGTATGRVKIKVIWPDGTESETTSASHTTVLITKDKTKPAEIMAENKKFRFNKVENFCGDDVGHEENKYNDFKVQFTLPYKQSACGPAVADGDINGDGITDYYIGGATGKERYFLLGQPDGTYRKFVPPVFTKETLYEDVAGVLYDIDGDGDNDLVVISGGVEFPDDPDFLTDRVYRNDGKGNFEKIDNVFPHSTVSKSCVAVGDFDNDGKPDLFIGGYTIPGKFEEIPSSFIYKNESDKNNIKFTDVTAKVLKGSAKMGMVTSASWVDMDGDHYPELILDGEWMPCKLFNNNKGILTYDSDKTGFNDLPGLYGTVFPTDYNGDGKMDFIVGNAGVNNQFKASKAEPINIYEIKDTANKINSGFMFSYYCCGVQAFASSRNEMLMEFVPYKRIFPDFSSYAKVDVKGFFDKVNLHKPNPLLTCTSLLSGVYINKGDGSYEFEPFPDLLQTSKITTVEQLDWNFDGKMDYVISGNFTGYKHQFGPTDALPSYILENQGKGKYRLVLPSESGLFSEGQIKKICVTQTQDKCRLLFVRNNDKILVYENHKK